MWLIVGLAPILSAIAVAWIQRPMRRQIRQVADDAAASRRQTENEHADAEYPNLRDEITAIRSAQDRLSENVGGLHSEVRDARRQIGQVQLDVEGIRTDVRRERRRTTALVRTVATAIDRAQGVIDEHHPGTQLRDPDPDQT